MSMVARFLRTQGLGWALVAGASCHNKPPGAAAGDEAADSMADPDTTTAGCSQDARIAAWQPGLTAKGDALTVAFVATRPPGAQASGTDAPTMGKNGMTVRVLDASARPIADAQLSLVASMPDHAHGPAIAQARAVGDTYVFDTVDLFMPGVWKFDFAVTQPGVATATASITLCIAG